MKRSEIINLLAVQFVERGMVGEPHAVIIADQILSLLELKGMQPPTIITLPDEFNRVESRYGFSVNEWEEENT